ncbi:MAG: hypothetical protein CMM07_14495 [Rhodopirellula sp.]|nr:hypothetical protein [Rhodopirellula sp.]
MLILSALGKRNGSHDSFLVISARFEGLLTYLLSLSYLFVRLLRKPLLARYFVNFIVWAVLRYGCDVLHEAQHAGIRHRVGELVEFGVGACFRKSGRVEGVVSMRGTLFCKTGLKP